MSKTTKIDSRIGADSARPVPGTDARILACSSTGVTIATAARPSGVAITWPTLRAAAAQPDADLAQLYSAVLTAAEQMRDAWEREQIVGAPLVASYAIDPETHVWWVARLATTTGVQMPRRVHGLTLVAADEGGTLAQPWLAWMEALDLAQRARRIWPTREVTGPGPVSDSWPTRVRAMIAERYGAATGI